MSDSPAQAFKIVLLCSATLALASCGGGASEANEATATDIDSNVMFEQLGNDASALEAAANAAPIAPADEGNETDETDANAAASSSEQQPVLGGTKGGDNGGNTVEGN